VPQPPPCAKRHRLSGWGGGVSGAPLGAQAGCAAPLGVQPCWRVLQHPWVLRGPCGTPGCSVLPGRPCSTPGCQGELRVPTSTSPRLRVGAGKFPGGPVLPCRQSLHSCVRPRPWVLLAGTTESAHCSGAWRGGPKHPDFPGSAMGVPGGLWESKGAMGLPRVLWRSQKCYRCPWGAMEVSGLLWVSKRCFGCPKDGMGV